MENSLKVLIRFDEKIIRKQLEKHYYYSWKRKLPSLLKYFLFITLFLTLIDSIFKADRSRADFLTFLGIFLLVTCLLYTIIFYFNKANYISKLNKHIEELKKFNPITELYFDENSFYIKSEQYDIRSIWKKITYNISGKTIVITIDMGTQLTYLVSQEETEQYQDILNFLKDKAKLKK